ncbi:MAG: PTS sugar transporter subunit IIA, partial [Myxococcales bacterium]|nr:PTS sugar transporter subunit IIA [Myxococcales bacterium]
RLTDLIREDLILSDLQAESKKAALRELAAVACDGGNGLDPDRVLSVLLEREKLGSTGIGQGVAVPHGKISGLKHMAAVLGRSFTGVEFQSLDNAPANLIFLLLAPEDAQNTHLQALAKICRILKDRGAFESLMKAEGPREIFEVLRKEEEKF